MALVVLAVALPLRIYWSERHWGKVEWRTLILAIPFLLTASMPSRFLDAGTYYNQAARWFEVGVPTGIGNFSLFLMQASIAHSNEALVNVLLGVGQNEVSALLSIYFVTAALARKAQPGWQHLVIGALLFIVWVHFTQASNADFLLIAILVFVFWKRPYAERSSSELLVLMVLLPFIKPVGAALSVVLFVEWIFKRRFQGWWLLPLGGAVFILKRIWVSGRVPLLPNDTLPFAIPDAAIEYLAFRNTFYDYPGRNLLPFNADLLILLVYLPVLYVFIRQYRGWQVWTYTFIHLVILSLWSVSYPAARYLFPFMVLMLIQLNSVRYGLPYRGFVVGCLVLGLVSVLPPWNAIAKTPRSQRFLAYGGWKHIHWVKPAPLWSPETRPLNLDNDFVMYLPTENHKCFDAAFPCNTHGVHDYGGDSIFFPVYHSNKHQFTYRAEPIGPETDSLLDARSSEPYLRRPKRTTH